MAGRHGPSSCARIQLGSSKVYAAEGGSFSQSLGMKVRGIETRLTTRIWFWFLAIPLLAVGSSALSFGFWAALNRTAGGTPVNVWGDMEGLVLAVWVGAGILFGIGMFGLIRWAIEVGSGRSRGHSSDEFGQMPSQAIRGLDPPMIGAPASITLDGIVERESGTTPSPPVVSVSAIIIVMVVMAIVGLAILTVVPIVSPPPVMP